MTILIIFFFNNFSKKKIGLYKLSFRFFHFSSIPRISTPVPGIPIQIPHIPTLIPRIPTQIPRIPTPIPHIPTLIPCITLILFLDSQIRLLQIAWISQQFEFSAHSSNEKFELFLEWTAFKELFFNSMVIEKKVCRKKKAIK